jgi:hypothetical protein
LEPKLGRPTFAGASTALVIIAFGGPPSGELDVDVVVIYSVTFEDVFLKVAGVDVCGGMAGSHITLPFAKTTPDGTAYLFPVNRKREIPQRAPQPPIFAFSYLPYISPEFSSDTTLFSKLSRKSKRSSVRWASKLTDLQMWKLLIRKSLERISSV